jgi:hypothetical protein
MHGNHSGGISGTRSGICHARITNISEDRVVAAKAHSDHKAIMAVSVFRGL